MDEETTKIHITQVLTLSKVMELIDEYPNLEEITCSPSVYNRISKKYIEALESLDITVKKEYHWGSKSKYSSKDEEILRYVKENKSAKEISEILNIPVSRVYYYVKKNKDEVSFDNYKRKHDLNTRKEIKSLNKEGLKPKEISEKLNVPVRTVYYILNNK
ncbi:hypothetical protein [Methanobrevibacter woesei]|uniref:hypothetical protein n=1 Tax=Methanobrevibacter woesei TaxID=190976 RepID=UPI0039F4AC95